MPCDMIPTAIIPFIPSHPQTPNTCNFRSGRLRRHLRVGPKLRPLSESMVPRVGGPTMGRQCLESAAILPCITALMCVGGPPAPRLPIQRRGVSASRNRDVALTTESGIASSPHTVQFTAQHQVGEHTNERANEPLRDNFVLQLRWMPCNVDCVSLRRGYAVGHGSCMLARYCYWCSIW